MLIAKSRLGQNYPSPFTHTTIIPYSLPSAVGGRLTAVELSVYDLTGRLVRTLVDELQDAGDYSVVWDGRTLSGRDTASRVYFYGIRAGELGSTTSMLLVR